MKTYRSSASSTGALRVLYQYHIFMSPKNNDLLKCNYININKANFPVV